MRQLHFFKDAWKSHRCIIPASYYYEWEHFKSSDGKVKTGDKYIIQLNGSMVTWLCGLYRIEDSFPVFTVLTREPSEELSRIHDRMPLIMPEEKIDEWISPDSKPENLLSYALTDMIMEKATENDEKDEPKSLIAFIARTIAMIDRIMDIGGARNNPSITISINMV